MTRGDIAGYQFLGRPIKPLALAIALSMATIFWFNIVEQTGILVPTVAGNIVGYCAGASAVLLFGGWWAKSQVLAETGMLIASGVWISRAVFIGMLEEWYSYSFFFSVAWAMASVGSYLLESFDPQNRK